MVEVPCYLRKWGPEPVTIGNIPQFQLGMMMQPELSHWNPHTAFLDQESLDYFTAELRQILRCLANHPSL